MTSLQKKKILDESLHYFSITFHVLNDNKKKYLSCIDKIGKFEESGKIIPIKLLREWISYIYPTNQLIEDEKIKNLEKYSQIADKVISYFSSQKQYQFKVISKQKVAFKFDDFIKSIIHFYYLNVWNENNINKNISNIQNRQGALNYFYSIITVNATHFDKPRKPLFTKYQKVVIAAYITQLLGYKCTYKKKITNKDLFQSSKNSISY